MELVTRNLMETFRESENFPGSIDQSTLFEHFSNYCVIASEHGEEFDLEDVHVGGEHDLQIDGIAIIVNGVIVSSPEEINDLLELNKYLDAEFIFVQAKTSPSFNGTDISNMFFGVRDLFSDSPKLRRNETVTEKEEIIKTVYAKSASFRRGNPRVKIYYVTTGKWQDDEQLTARIRSEVETLEDLNIFQSQPQFAPIGAREPQ